VPSVSTNGHEDSKGRVGNKTTACEKYKGITAGEKKESSEGVKVRGRGNNDKMRRLYSATSMPKRKG
jgi:hypothetical protein